MRYTFYGILNKVFFSVNPRKEKQLKARTLPSHMELTYRKKILPG